MEAARTARVSEAEFLALPETLDKVELIDGEIVETPSPVWAHQLVLGRVYRALANWAAAQSRPVSVGQAPMDIRFAPGRILQPDVFVVLDGIPYDLAGPLERVPELCVEVLSTNRAHDRLTKRFVFAAAGVQEYWVVDPSGVVERWTGPELSDGEDVASVLTTPLLPGFELSLEELFRGGGDTLA